MFYFFPIHFMILFFFFNDTATTEIYTLSLHDALPILVGHGPGPDLPVWVEAVQPGQDRKSTRLNSSHVAISYAVFCLKKKKNPDRSVPGRTIYTINLRLHEGRYAI